MLLLGRVRDIVPMTEYGDKPLNVVNHRRTDWAIGRKVTDDLVISLEVAAPIIKDYPVYNFKAELKIVVKLRSLRTRYRTESSLVAYSIFNLLNDSRVTRAGFRTAPRATRLRAATEGELMAVARQGEWKSYRKFR
jgi:hypothetical protein